jgi:hypothetical protein
MDTAPADAYAVAMNGSQERHRDNARAELEKLRHESDTVGATLDRLLRRTGTHFAGHDAGGTNDPVEIWGRRIGRGLSAIAVVALCIYLYATYLR